MAQEETKRTHSGAAKHGPDGAAASSSALEPHFSIADVAALWNLSDDVVRDIFRHEDGVLGIGTVSSRGKRRYMTLRIPASVLERVHRQMSLSNQYPKR
jgi:hypothetical protein